MATYLAQALAHVFRAPSAQSQDADPKAALVHRPRPSLAESLPAMEYPTPLLVRNSFFNTETNQPLSLDLEPESRCHTRNSFKNAETNEPLSLDFEPESRLHTPSSNRSTSVGSSSESPVSSNEASPSGTKESDIAIPAKNTFVHFDIGRPLSLEGFFDERTLRSCPASVIDEPTEDPVLEDATVSPSWPLSIPPPPVEPPVLSSEPLLDNTAPPAEDPVLPEDGLSEDELPEAGLPLPLSSVLPSVGSAKHLHQYRRGKCRPCAHVHTTGCKNGADCAFCHLCPPGELKRRHKEKRQQKAQRLARRRAADAGGPTSPPASP